MDIPSAQLGTGFWIITVSFTLVLIGVSLYLTRRIKSSDDFFRASGKASWWINGLSFIMAAFSASVFVANASLAYNRGGLNALLILAQLPVFVAGFMFFARLWHRSGVHTAVEFIGSRFGQPTAKFFLYSGVPIRILDNANRLYVTGVLIECLMGIPLWQGVAFAGIVAVLFTVGGGFMAVLVTDAIQALILAAVSVVIAVAAVIRVGGVHEWMAKVPEGYWSMQMPGSDMNIWLIMAWVFVGLFAWNGNWALVQRYVSVPTERDATKVTLMAGISYYIIFPLLAIPPMVAVVLLPQLQGAIGGERSYILLAQTLLPAALLGLLSFAMLGTTVTAVGSELNVMAQVLVENLLVRIFPTLGEKAKLTIGRCLIVILMTLCLTIALQIRNFGGAFKYLMTILGMTSLPVYMPMLLGLLEKRAPGWGAVSSCCAGIVVSVLMKFVWGAPLAAVIFTNGLVTLAVYFISGWISPSRLGFSMPKRAAVVAPATEEEIAASVEQQRKSFNRPIAWSLTGMALVLLVTALLSGMSGPDLALALGTVAILLIFTFVISCLPKWLKPSIPS